MYLDSLAVLDDFNVQEKAEFIDAIRYYHLHGDLPNELSKLVKIGIKHLVQQFERDRTKWEETRQKRVIAGQQGGLAKVAKSTTAKQHLVVGNVEPIAKDATKNAEYFISQFSFSEFPDNLKEHLCEWIKQRFKKKQLKNEDQLRAMQRALLRDLKDGKDIARAIDDTIANNWQGLTYRDIHKDKPKQKTMRDINDPSEHEIPF